MYLLVSLANLTDMTSPDAARLVENQQFGTSKKRKTQQVHTHYYIAHEHSSFLGAAFILLNMHDLH